jgi:hypothetical protein
VKHGIDGKVLEDTFVTFFREHTCYLENTFYIANTFYTGNPAEKHPSDGDVLASDDAGQGRSQM